MYADDMEELETCINNYCNRLKDYFITNKLFMLAGTLWNSFNWWHIYCDFNLIKPYKGQYKYVCNVWLIYEWPSEIVL